MTERAKRILADGRTVAVIQEQSNVVREPHYRVEIRGADGRFERTALSTFSYLQARSWFGSDGLLDLTLRCPECGKRADMCFAHGDAWKRRA